MECEYTVLFKQKKKKVTLLDTGQRNTTIAIVISPTFMDLKRYHERERNKINARKWKDRNPDKYQRHLEWVRQWRRKPENKKKSLEYNQKWRDAHREEYRKQQREYARKPEVKERAKARYNRRKAANQKGLKRKRGTNNETKSINSRGKNV